MEEITEKIETGVPFIFKSALRNGCIVGLFSIILMMATYAMDPTMLAKWWLSLLFYFIGLGLVIYYALDIRKKVGGYMSFVEAMLAVFVMFLVTSFISQIFNYVLFTYIDPELTQVLKEAIVNQTTSMMERFGAPQEEIDKAIAKIETEDYGMSIGRAIKGFLFGALFSMIVSMAVALGVKRNPPVFLKNTSEQE